MRNSEILKVFYKEYHRSPTYEEFMYVGGKCQERLYGRLLTLLGYPQSTRAFTVQVFDTRGRMIFEGTVKQAAERFDKHITFIRACANKGHKLCNEYTVKRKEVRKINTEENKNDQN